MSESQPITEHLVELKNRILNCIWGILIGAIAAFSVSEQIFDFIRHPIAPYLPEGGLIFTGVTEKFMAHLKMSGLVGVIVSCPWWLYQIWCFLAPGLYRKEKKYALVFLTAGTFLFVCGAAFTYFLVLPAAFKYLLFFGGNVDKAMISVNEYISFFLSMILVFGAAFELPLVIVLTAMLGLVDEEFLRTKRRYAIVGLSLVSALVTPPDLMSMVMLLIPMVLLYELSIWIVKFVVSKRVVDSQIQQANN